MHEVNSYHSTFGRAVEVVQCGMRQEVEELLREAWWQSLDTAFDLNSPGRDTFRSYLAYTRNSEIMLIIPPEGYICSRPSQASFLIRTLV